MATWVTGRLQLCGIERVTHENERLYPPHNPDSQPYWEGLKERRLMLQRCADCGKVRHYPRPVCSACHSMESDWFEASRRGTLHSWSVSRHAFHPSFKPDLPMTFVTVDLDEGVRLLGIYKGAGEPDIGAAVVIRFEDVRGADFTLPVIHPA